MGKGLDRQFFFLRRYIGLENCLSGSVLVTLAQDESSVPSACMLAHSIRISSSRAADTLLLGHQARTHTYTEVKHSNTQNKAKIKMRMAPAERKRKRGVGEV